jgi:hypothetical protein
MNYSKIYENLITKARIENREKGKKIYYENHHIIPKCLGGSNKKDNLILLTAKEHYVAHKLLVCLHPENRKMVLAFFYMSYDKKHTPTSRDYARAKELLHSIPVSKETIRKMKRHKFSEEHKQRISKALTGLTQSSETIEKRRLKHLGRKNTEETKRKMSESRKGKKLNYDVWNKGKTKLDITPKIIKEVKDLKERGLLQKEIANKMNFSISAVARMLNGFYDNKQ